MSAEEAQAGGGGPTISAVIRCYNQGRFLAQAIESVLGQGYVEREAIVVDDGSTDSTREVASRYGDRIRYLRQRNSGRCAAANAGIQAATGDFLHFLDADDYLLPGGYERLVAAARQDPAAAVVHGGHHKVDVEGGLLEVVAAVDLGAEPFARLLQGNCFPIHVALLRREAAARAGLLDVSLDYSEDWDLWLRVAEHGGRFRAVDAAVAAYRKYPGTATTDRARLLRAQLEILSRRRRMAAGRRERRWIRAGRRRSRMNYLRFLFEERPRLGVASWGGRLLELLVRDPTSGVVLAGWLVAAAWRRVRGRPQDTPAE